MASKIYIRTDGGPTIGLGHLVRCQALANILKDDFAISFACKEAPGPIAKDITDTGFDLIYLKEEADLDVIIAPGDTIVIDHYRLDSDYQLQLKNKGCKVVCIDDLHEGHFYADLIINHAPGVMPVHYNAEPYTNFALGLGYALLRPEFLEAAKLEPSADAGRAFICFGGADPQNLVLQALKGVMDADGITAIDVVTGGSYQGMEALAPVAAADARVKLHSELSAAQMCTLMQRCDIAIIPSSSILIEAIACGMRILTCYYVDNQKDFHDGIKAMGINSVGFVNAGFQGKVTAALSAGMAETPDSALRGLLYNVEDNYRSKFKTLNYGKVQ